MVFIIPNYILTIKYNGKNMIWCKKIGEGIGDDDFYFTTYCTNGIW